MSAWFHRSSTESITVLYMRCSLCPICKHCNTDLHLLRPIFKLEAVHMMDKLGSVIGCGKHIRVFFFIWLYLLSIHFHILANKDRMQPVYAQRRSKGQKSGGHTYACPKDRENNDIDNEGLFQFYAFGGKNNIRVNYFFRRMPWKTISISISS